MDIRIEQILMALEQQIAALAANMHTLQERVESGENRINTVEETQVQNEARLSALEGTVFPPNS